MPRPLVSIVTPTWNRPALLAETIRHVREQSYPNLEHVVVSDGPDRRVFTYDLTRVIGPGKPPLHVAELGRNWSGLMPDSFGIAPLTVGYLLARGEYIAPWCDDERALTPDHLTKLVDLLESSGADFAYPQVQIWRNGHPEGPETAVIGSDPPAYTQITHYLFRASALHRYGMPTWGTHPVDWHMVESWLAAGARWAYLPECTFSHRLDQ